MAVDNAGNFYIAGGFQGANFDPSGPGFNLTSLGKSDVVVAKYSATGSFIWAFNIGSYTNFDYDEKDMANAIATDGSGNVYVAGNLEGVRADVDPFGTHIFYPSGSFVAKYNTNGSFGWIAATGDDRFTASGIVVDNGGNVFVAGSTSGLDRVEVHKYNSNGIESWSFNINGSANRTPHGNAIILDDENNFYITGTLDGSTVGSLQITNGNMFIAKYDSSGNLQKAYGFDVAEGNGLAYYDNHIYVVGNGEGDFDPLPPVANYSGKSFVAKFTTNLELTWVRMFDGGGNDFALNTKDIAVDYQGNLFVSGDFSDSIDFNPTSPGGEIISTSRNNGFLASFTKDGDFRGVHNLASTQDVSVEDVTVNSNGDIFLTGSFSGIADFDFLSGAVNLTSAGSKDIFLTWYGNSWVGIANLNKIEKHNIFPNPNTGSFTIQLEARTEDEIQVEVLNILGQSVYQTNPEKAIGQFSVSIELKDATSGIYLVRLKVGKAIANQKIIVQ